MLKLRFTPGIRNASRSQIEPLDPWSFGITALVLLLVATFASYVPARRGMHITPVDALRTK